MTTVDVLKSLSAVAGVDWAALERAYATPPRAYHTLEHVLEVARHWAQETWAQPEQTFRAVLFHDAVYVAGRSDNEQKSADLSGDDPRVRELILLTAKHGRLKPGDVDEEAAKFLDCDMAILGAEPDAFALYQQQIAREYEPVVGHDAYVVGRAKFLRGLLEKERIFLSDRFHARLDARARDNLRRALK
ncbi:MAG: hypothetical protein JNK82_08075 [Myxococcaceae bacterium]|nr:hypothetical protein [Myxococcaceae bacterium]